MRRFQRNLRTPLCIVVSTLISFSFAATLIMLPNQVTAQAPKEVTGIGPWIESTDYGSASGNNGTSGLALNLLSCATWSGYVYCAGGFGAPTPSLLTSQVFYAPLNLSGIGGWTETTDYGASSGTSGSGGAPINAESCVANGGYIYCVGGQTYASGNYNQVSDVFYAPLSSTGVGAWTETTDFGTTSGSSGTGGLQLYHASCVTYTTYIYCAGGELTPGKGSATFYAPLSSTGVGPWAETTDFGASSGTSGAGGVKPSEPSCTVNGDYIYCIGGDKSAVFYAPLSSSGIGGWTETTDYGASSGTTGSGGIQIDATSCASYSDYVFCVGGRNASAPDDTTISRVYFTEASSSGVGAWNRTTDYGDAAIVMSNAVPFWWYVQPGCAMLGVTGTGSAGAAGSRTFITHALPTLAVCIPVTKAKPKISTSLSAPIIVVGGSVSDIATLTGATTNAGGTVSFFEYLGSCTGPGSGIGSGTLASGVANSGAMFFNTAGSFGIEAYYPGDPNNGPATSPCEPLTVVKASPTISTKLASSTITVGGTVSDSATLSGGFNVGSATITFFKYLGSCTGPGASVGYGTLSNSVANSGAMSFNTLGSFGIEAYYPGDGNNNHATSSCEPLTVVKASPTISTSLANPTMQLGGSTSDSATLSGATPNAGGNVTYQIFLGAESNPCLIFKSQFKVIVANGAVPGSPQYTPSTSGAEGFQAVYSGDANNNPAMSECEPLNVTPGSTPPANTSNSSTKASTSGNDAWENLFIWNEKYSGWLVYIPIYAYGTFTIIGLGTYYYWKRVHQMEGEDEYDDDVVIRPGSPSEEGGSDDSAAK